MKRCAIGLVVAVATLECASAQVTNQLAYEGFDYLEGGTVAGAATGTGWVNAWGDGGESGSTNSDFIIGASSLNVPPGSTNSGRRVELNGLSGERTLSRDLGTRLGSQAGVEYTFSYVLGGCGSGVDYAGVELSLSGATNTTVFIGKPAGYGPGTTGNIGMQVSGMGSITTAVSAGLPRLLQLKWTGNNGPSSLILNIYSAVSGAFLGSTNVTFNGRFNRVKLVAKRDVSVGANAPTFDEIQTTGAPNSAHNLTVESVNPSNGVTITMSLADTNGLQNGVTTFARAYYDDTIVQLTAPAAAGGNNFQNWQRNGVDYSTSPAVSLNIDADYTMTAIYATAPAGQTRTLTVASSNPNSGIPITVSPPDTNGQSSATTQFTRTYFNNVSVTLTAPASVNSYFRFSKWQRDAVDFSTNTSVNITMDADHAMTAVYTVPAYRPLIVASANPSAGIAVTVSPADTNGLANGTTQFTRTYATNVTVLLTAPATVAGNNFYKWQRNGIDLSFNQSVSTKADRDYTMTAVYISPSRQLTVTSSNPVSGVTIALSPADNFGVTNGSTTFAATYPSNSVVTLSAPATISGKVFRAWRLDGVDYDTNLITAVTMDGDHAISAAFDTPLDEQITSIVREGNDVRITWTTWGGRGYVLQASSVVNSNNFSDVSPVITMPGTSNTNTNYLEFGTANAPARFYRIRIIP